MSIKRLPVLLRVLLALQPIVAIPLVYAAWMQPHESTGWLLPGLLALTLLFSIWRCELEVFEGRITPTFALVCLALLVGGGRAALLCSTVGSIATTLVGQRPGSWKARWIRAPLHRLWFNLFNCAIACAGAILLYNLVERVVPDHAIAQVLGLALFAGVYFALNSLGLSLAIACQQGISWLSVWHDKLLWTALGFFASACAAATIQMAWERFGYRSLPLLFLLGFVFYGYRLYLDRHRLATEKVEQEIAHMRESNELHQAILTSLATAIDAKDHHTRTHIQRVRCYAESLARAAGVEGLEFEAISTGAIVHDVGKLAIPDHILGKPGKLTPEEFAIIQSHVPLGAEILAPVPFKFPVMDVVLSHHERWDGLGYPRGIQGEDIPIGGRILTIVDVYDALTSQRPYRKPASSEEALAALRAGAGKQFDPRLVELFAEVLPGLKAEIEALESAAAAMPVEHEFEREKPGFQLPVGWEGALESSLTLDQLGRQAVSFVMEHFPVDTVVWYVPSAEGDLQARFVAGHYAGKLLGMRLQPGEGASGWAANMGRSRLNVSAFLDVARRFTPDEAIELSTGMVVPTPGGGVLAAYCRAYSTLNESHLPALEQVAARLGSLAGLS